MPRTRLAWVLLAAACEPVPTPARAPIPQVPIHEGEPAPSAPETVLPAPVPARPARPLPSRANPQLVKIAESICGAAWMETAAGSITIGCRSGSTTPAKITEYVDEDPLSFCSMTGVFKGSFTKPGAKETMVAFEQCAEPDVTWDSGNPGHAVIVEETKEGYREVKTIGGVNADSCKPAKRAAGQRDALVCRSSFHAPPAGKLSYVFVLDGSGAHTIMRLFADDASCMMAAPDYKVAGGISEEAIRDFSVGTDITVDIERGRVAPSPALDKQVGAICNRDPSATFDTLVPAPKKIRLLWNGKGESFTPSPDTKKKLETFEAEAPADYNGMRGAAPN